MDGRLQENTSKENLLAEQKNIDEAKKNPLKFEQLYNTYYERIFRFIYQRVDKKEIAFDLTQQVFMKAMLNIRRYEHRGFPFSSWLYRIARNELNQLFRKNNSCRTINIDETDLKYVADEMKTETLSDEYSQQLADVISELDE